MYRYAKISDYDIPRPHWTKKYQRAFMLDWLPRYVTPTSRVMDVGANINIDVLSELQASERWVVDPYEGIAGAKQTEVPVLPESITVSRCLIGLDSHALPSDYFDVIFSISVIEHIGQEAAKYDCTYTPNPPEAQEIPRRAFCAECFRLLRPGGVTIHAIDHGVRNVTYDANFKEQGFVPLLDDQRFEVNEMLDDPEAFRQETQWGDHSKLMQEEFFPLNTVLMLGYQKPMGTPRRFAERPGNA